MDLGAVGNGILFVCILVGMTIVGIYVLGYAAYCVLIVVQGTAAETHEVTWPDEPLVDCLRQSLSLLALVLIWLVPAGLLSRGLSEDWLVHQDALRTILLAGPGLWLLFPVGLLSSLSAVSRWVFFRPVIAWQMLRLFSSTVTVYLVSAVLAALATICWYATIFGGFVYLLALTAPLSAALLLIYARLIGRLAYRIQRLEQKPGPPRKRGPAKKPKIKTEVSDPWAEPEEELDEEPEEEAPEPRAADDEEADEWDQDYVRGGYGLADAGEKPDSSAPPQSKPLDPEEENARRGYGLPTEERMQAADRMTNVPPPPRPGPSIRPRRTRNLLRTQRKGKEPAWPMVSGVYDFPWRGKTLRAWVWLSFGLVLFGLGLIGLRSFWPGG